MASFSGNKKQDNFSHFLKHQQFAVEEIDSMIQWLLRCCRITCRKSKDHKLFTFNLSCLVKD